MKPPQVPAMPGMTPLEVKLRFKCPYCGSDYMLARNGDDAQCGRHGCYKWSTKCFDVVPLNRLATDQKTVAERKWQSRKLAPAPQKPCDVGLFSDDANQKELF